MLIVVDFFAQLVLLLVHLGLLIVGQIAPVSLSVRPDFFVHLRFLVLQLGRLSGGQRAVLDAVPDALLLVLFALLNLSLFVVLGE